MDALLATGAPVAFEIFTTVPRWLFEDSLAGSFRLRPVMTDVGLIQRDSLRADLPGTLRALGSFLPFDSDLVAVLAATLRETGCTLVVCDIAPLGIAVARRAGIPSVLVENFTWDWIYAGYVDEEPELGAHAEFLAEVLAAADLRIQTEPVCLPWEGARKVAPVSRRPRRSREEERSLLRVPDGAHVILLTMGGVPWEYGFLDRLEGLNGFFFVVPGASSRVERRANALLLPDRSAHYHPDLMGAADAVVGKVGYSTLAEAYHAGVRFGIVPREGFRESQVLTTFALDRLPALEIPEPEYATGRWLDRLPDLFALPSRSGRSQEPGSGAPDVAKLLLEVLS